MKRNSKNLFRCAICGLILTLVGCSGGFEGKYRGTVSGDFGPILVTLDFRSGGKLFLTNGSEEKAGTFDVDGDKVTIVVDGHSTVFTRGSDGALTGPGNRKFTKQLRSYSTGERTGYVQKLSSKTWKGELAMVSMPGTLPEIFAFAVRTDSIAARINASLGKRVKLTYELPIEGSGETENFVTHIEVVE